MKTPSTFLCLPNKSSGCEDFEVFFLLPVLLVIFTTLSGPFLGEDDVLGSGMVCMDGARI